MGCLVCISLAAPRRWGGKGSEWEAVRRSVFDPDRGTEEDWGEYTSLRQEPSVGEMGYMRRAMLDQLCRCPLSDCAVAHLLQFDEGWKLDPSLMEVGGSFGKCTRWRLRLITRTDFCA